MGGRLDVELDAVEVAVAAVVAAAVVAAAAVFALGVAALSEVCRAGLDSEFAGAAAGRFTAGGVGLVGVVVFVGSAVVAAAAASGGVEDLGLSPAEGDGALTSSTGLFYKSTEEILNILNWPLNP